MNTDRTFTNVDDTVLVKLISQASHRVVFVAPGLRKVVADALADALKRLPGKVMVVLDVDAEVCRLGYGDEEGLVSIKDAAEKAGSRLHHQPGVRIGLVIADSDTIVYSPVPLLIEADSDLPDKPNAIILNGSVPAAIEAACGVGVEADAARQVGMEFVNEAALEAVKADLKASPPKEFNIARIERVFNSALHFIELEILDYRLRAKKVRLDVELFGMGDTFLRERVENTFKPFDDAEFLTLRIPKLGVDGMPVPKETEIFGPEVIEQERNRLKKEFLFDIPKFGVVIRRANKQEFEQRLELLKQRLKLYIVAVQKNIKDHLAKAKEKLKASLVEVVRKNPPPAWKKFMDSGGLSAEEAGRLLDDALDKAFAGMVSEFNPTIRWIYKDVTYETIHNVDFRKGLEKSFGVARADKLFSEHDAAPEK
jgi:hypothetical protein